VNALAHTVEGKTFLHLFATVLAKLCRDYASEINNTQFHFEINPSFMEACFLHRFFSNDRYRSCNHADLLEFSEVFSVKIGLSTAQMPHN
jgi:hypothetical protein